MIQPTDSPVLRMLAALFREAGDSTTADALGASPDAQGVGSIGQADLERVLALRIKGVNLDSSGAHLEAEGYLLEVLQRIEQALGRNHVDVIEHVNDLARCRFNGSNFAQALGDYRRLRHLVEQAYGVDHPLAEITRHQIKQCQIGLRIDSGARSLQAHADRMVRRAIGAKPTEHQAYQDRLRAVAQRLFARGRIKLGAALLARRFALRCNNGEPPDEATLVDLRDYAIALWDAGQVREAASAFQTRSGRPAD